MTSAKYLKRLYSIDWLLLIYILGTALFILLFYQRIQSAAIHLILRTVLLVFVLCLPLLDKHFEKPLFVFFRFAYPIVFLSFFYSETDSLNNVFADNLDYHFARLDSMLFGFQPSLAFYDLMPYKWFSELMNFGYFSYYFLIAAYSIYIFINQRIDFLRTVFIITCSFLIYYLIFVFVPVSGPQYFFQSPHNQIADSGLFRSLVKMVEFIGERPTAAFPSSHVGIVLILVIMAWAKNKRTYYWLLPFFVLLTLSTIYIKAHYAVDAIGGIVSAPLIYGLSVLSWKSLNKKLI